MSEIVWDDSLKRGIAFQDADHEESVALMNAMQTCSDAELPGAFAKHLAHLREHLERENALMQRTEFFAMDVHIAEHDRVLAEHSLMQSSLNAGDLATVRRYVEEDLPAWFVRHLNTLDTAIALVAKQHGES